MFYAYSAKTGREREAEEEGRKEGGRTEEKEREYTWTYVLYLVMP